MDREDFRKRQEADFLRQKRVELSSGTSVQRRQPFHLRYSDHEAQTQDTEGTEADGQYGSESGDESSHTDVAGEEGWRNSEGERLADFGVEESVEFYDEDDIPLAELIRARRAR